MNFILNTSRKIDNDQLKEFTFGDISSLEEKLAVAFLNPQDLKKININSKAKIKITSQSSSIVVRGLEDSKVPEGMILLPVSIWSNQLTEIEGEEIKYKNIKVTVESTSDSILSFNNILRRIRGT